MGAKKISETSHCCLTEIFEPPSPLLLELLRSSKRTSPLHSPAPKHSSLEGGS